MSRKTAADFHPAILEIFDGYVHGKLSKREFIERAAKFAAVGVTGAMIFDQLRPDYALAQQVKADDPAIKTERPSVSSPKGHGKISGLLAMPAKAKGKIPAVLVIHENRGLNPYIEDVARRLAKAGYLAFAPDGLTSVGGYPGSDDKGRELQAKLDPKKLFEDFIASLDFLRLHAKSTGKVGAVGFRALLRARQRGGRHTRIEQLRRRLERGAPIMREKEFERARQQVRIAAQPDRVGAIERHVERLAVR